MNCFKNNNSFTDSNDFTSKIRQRTLVNHLQSNSNYSNNVFSSKLCSNNKHCCFTAHIQSHNQLIDIKKAFHLVTNKNLTTQNAFPYQNMCFHNNIITNNNSLDPSANTFPQNYNKINNIC